MNTTHLLAKKVLIALIVGLLSSFVVFSQSSDMQWTMHVDNLNVGGTGKITIRGKNISNNTISISNILLPMYKGVHNLDYPTGDVIINGNHSSFNPTSNFHIPYDAIQPHSSIELSYRVAAKCEAIYEAGDSITVLEQGKIKYSNGTEENLDRASFSISYPRLQLVDKRMIIGEENQADLILKIVNLMQGVPAQNIRFNINFTNDARPLSQDMYAQISKDGEHWSNSIWTGNSYSNPSEFNFTNANLQNIGLEGLQYGDTLFVRFPLQLTSSVTSFPLGYEMLFSDTMGNYCSNKAERGNISIVRQTGNPHLVVTRNVLEPVDFCNRTNGIVLYTIMNTGDGVAYINSINLGRHRFISPVSAKIAGIDVLGRSGDVSMPTSNIDGIGGLEDINKDNIFSELAPGDSVVIETEYALNSSFYESENPLYSFRASIEYQSISGQQETAYSNYLEGGYALNNFGFTGANIVNLEQSQSYEYDLNINTRAIQSFILNGHSGYYTVSTTTDGITINGSPQEFNGTFTDGNFHENIVLDFDENLPCGDYTMNISFGINSNECDMIKTLQTFSHAISIVKDNIRLNLEGNNVVLTEFFANRANFGWNVDDVRNIIPYKRVMENLPRLDKETSRTPNLVYERDTVQITLKGEYNIIDHSNEFITAIISMSNASLFNVLNATYQIGDQNGNITVERDQNILYCRVPLENVETSHDSIQIDILCLTVNNLDENINIFSTLQMERSVGEVSFYNSCNIQRQTIECRERSFFEPNSNRFCSPLFSYSLSNGYEGEYKPNIIVDGFVVFRDEGLSLDMDNLTVSLVYNHIDIPCTVTELTDRYVIQFAEPILVDASQRFLQLSFQPQFPSYESTSKKVNIQLIVEGQNFGRKSIDLWGNPIINISQPVVVSSQKKIVTWDVTVSGNSQNIPLHFKWKSNQMHLIDVRNADRELIAQNNSDIDSIFFDIPPVDRTSIISFTAEIQDCANGDTLHSLLQMALDCNETIDESTFDTFIVEGYNRNLDATVNSISLPVTQPTFETRYMNLCDTAYYSFQISNLGADTSNISFWLDNISENVNVKTVEATIDSDTYQLGNYNTPSSRNITTDVLRNSSTDNIDEANTIVNIGLSVECDPTKDYIDVTKPINAHVLRYDICNNPIQEDFSIKPNIKGFENMDSIRFTATAVNFDNQGIGTVSVSLQNNDLQLIDSVDFTVILPEGLEYVENSTTPNYFSSIQNNGQSVVWAFERNKHVDGNENLQFTFQVRNANRCEQGDFTLKMATSLERTLHGSCSDACLVKKTSDTIQITMQQEPVKLIESITTDKKSVCAGDSFIVSVQDNNNGIYTLSAEPTGLVSIDGNTITTNPQAWGQIMIKATATDGDCQDEAQTTVTINALPQPVIEPISLNFIEKGYPIQLFASPVGGVWSGIDMESSGLFRAEHSGIHTIYYTVTNGECSNSDSVQITVGSCDKEIFIEPDSLNVSEQASIITIPVSISPIEECGYCSELRSMKFNITFDGDDLEYSGVELQQLQQSVDMYDRLENNTVVVQLYSNTVNGFVTQGGELLYLTFNVKHPENTDILISNGYYNGELQSQNLTNDTLHIFYTPKPIVTLNDTVFCAGGQVELVPIVENPSNGELRYQWNNRQNTPTIIVSRAGDYVVTVYDSFGSYDSKHVVVSEAPAIVAELADTAFCEGTTITIQPNITQGEISQYEWNTGENTAAISVSSAGTYTVTMTDIYGCTSGVPANVTVNENSEIPVFTYNRNNMDSYTATISNAVENNVYMWHGSEGVTFDSNQSPSVTISVASYPAAICVDSKDVNGCTSVSHCDTIPQTPPISILGNNVLCLQNMGFEWLRQEFQIESPSSGSNYVWSLSDNSMAELNPVSNGIEVRPFGIQGDVDLIVQEFRNGELVNEGRETLQIRVRPQSGNLAIYGPNEWTSLCPYEPNVQYSIPRQGNFIWSVPEDAQITSGQGTNNITITFGREGGDIFAREQNGEGCFAYTALHTWVGTHSANCGSLKSFTIEDFESQPNEIQLEQYTEELNVAIYPVPVENVLNIVANANIENVIIYTSSGSEVKTVAKQNQIDVSSLLSGDYFVRIVTDKGVVTKSIIVVK